MSSFPIIDGSQLADAPGGLVLLDFWQASCAPCRALEPRLERFAEANPGQFTGYRIDVDTDIDTRPSLLFDAIGSVARRTNDATPEHQSS